MFVAWGWERTLLYNDAYSEILADKHPSALGRDFLEVWSEIRPELVPIVEEAYAGRPVQMDDITLIMLRKGFPEETHFSFSYTPVRDESGAVAGFFCPCLEITEQVLSDRRRTFRLALEERLRDLADPIDIVSAASEALGLHMNVAQVAYAEVDADGETVSIEREWNSGAMASNAGRHRLVDFGPAFAADLMRGERVAIADVRQDPRTSSPEALSAFAKLSIASFLNIPLVKAGRLVAVLAIHNLIPRTWSADEIGLVEEFAERIRAAVEQARAEAHLQETSRRLSALLDNASVSIFLMDSDHRCQYMNPAAEALTGFSLDETRGNHLHDVIHHTRPDGSRYPSHECPIDGVSPSVGRQQGEEVFVHKSGRFIPVAFTASPVRNEAGEPIGTVIEVQDMTEQKAAEAELQENRARLQKSLSQAERKAAEMQAVLESMPDAVYIGTGEGITLANQHALDQLGFTSREELNRRVAALAEEIETRDAETGVLISVEGQAFTRAFRGERIVQNVRVRHRLTGEDRVVRCAAAPVTVDGHVIAAVAVNTDITDAKRGEAALRESEARFRDIADAAPVLIWISDTTKACTWFNRPWLEFTGRTMEEEYGYGWAEGVHADDFDRCVSTYNAAFDNREPFRMDYRLRQHDGTYRILDDVGVPRFAEDGTFLGYIGACTDVTDARRAEEDLRELADTLESRVTERTVELEQAHEQLRQSQKLEAMGALTGGVAHDFNNLLTPIVGSLDLLQRRSLGGEREQRLIAGAIQSADRAKTLVQRLLAFARRQPLQASAVDIRRLVEGMADLLGSTTGPQVRVVVEVAEDLPPAKADPNQLEMALLNLGVNARDAMPNGGTLRISATRESIRAPRGDLRRGHYVRLSVADTGMGMDEATLARAVEPFFSTKGIGKGTGLGLSMAHGLAAQLGGALIIQSRPEVGTNVELWLPISAVVAGIEDISSVSSSLGEAHGLALLVDDEEFVRESTADMLEEFGYQVRQATSGEAALALVSQGLVPDLLVSDHLMPGLSGVDLARRLRETLPHLPVLIVSGYAEAEGIAPDLPRLTKPFRSAELEACLAAIKTH
ncbi:PAS domain S-box protein [Sphingobium sp. SCG-1]|uniref:PAS domain S-box protein n=1 Tax=Sphingobium sp. SCG-1 TaxID=2072936 RepID=UPI0016701CB9